MFTSIVGALVSALASKGMTAISEAVVDTVSTIGDNALDTSTDAIKQAADNKIKEMIKDVTGIEVKSADDVNDDLIARLQENEEAFMERLVERNRHEEHMAKLDLDAYEKQVAAQDGARDDMIHALESDSGAAKFAGLVIILTAITVLSLSGWLYYLLIVTPDLNQVSVASSKSFIEAVIMMIIGFLFGSSYGSKKKDHTLSAIAMQQRTRPRVESDLDMF